MISLKLSKNEFLSLISAFENFCFHNHSNIYHYAGQSVSFSENEFNDETVNPKMLVELLENRPLVKRQQSGTVFTPDTTTYEIVSLVLNMKMSYYFAKTPNSHNLFNFKENFWVNFNKWVKNSSISQLSSFLGELFGLFLSKNKILDPAVGGGSFIFTTFLKYLEFYVLLYPYYINPNKSQLSTMSLVQLLGVWNQRENTSSIEKRFKFLHLTFHNSTPSQKSDIIHNFLKILNENIVCFDIDPIAVRVTKIRLHCLLKTFFGHSAMEKTPLSIQTHSLDFLSVTSKNILPYFDIILGNPPYVGSDSLAKFYPRSHHEDLKNKFREVVLLGSKPDLYFYFIKRSLDLLAKEGILGFIIPNRILSNTYAQKLREYIFSVTRIDYVITFSDTLEIFPSANVHPCVILLTKPNIVGDPKNYITKHFTNLEKINQSGWDLGMNTQIPLALAKNYNLFLSGLSSKNILFLEKMASFSPLKSILHIREGTRLARFKSKYPPSFPYRISKDEWSNLSLPEQSQYLAEIRGKQIKSYSILPTTSYLALPNLLLSNNIVSQRLALLEKYSKPTVFIRELGKEIFASYIDCSSQPSIGYGGVYFFQYADFTAKFLKTFEKIDLPSSDVLLAFLVYFSSTFFLKLYRILFTTGSWGNALKFRSSYFEQIPFVPFNYELFAVFGQILMILNHPSSLKSYEKVKNTTQLITWIEGIREKLLIGRIYSQDVPTISNFEKFLLGSLNEFHFFKDLEYSLDKLENLLNFLSITRTKISSQKFYSVFLKEVSDCENRLIKESQ
ncbi:Eco57I restriction-modification methylase domain-containing protein [Candidatus Lokiarchaeum ossiferum]|uniref:Eco57I restriction-modification methylase domain-containing protein n=1 Tax=Candidatus Lokiarchaeum ossiferum TaxID=2951803 RepID=UPI00352F8349